MQIKNTAKMKDLHRVCHLLHHITKLDIRMVDEDAQSLTQFVTHTIPPSIYNLKNDYQLIHETLKKNTATSYYYYVDSYNLEYMTTGLWLHNTYYGAVILGPFISTVPGTSFMNFIISNNNIPISERKQLQQFYASLAVIGSSLTTHYGELLVNLCTNPYQNAQLITSDVIQPANPKSHDNDHIDERKMTIEATYKGEKKLMHAITHGDKDSLKDIFIEIGEFNFDDRIPENPIRSFKNIMLVLNTLCRSSAEKGGVHPLYIHDLSEKYAILIERAPSIPYLQKMHRIMLEEYCNLVNEHSTRSYSPIVRRAVEYIKLHLESPLSLQEIATHIHVNPSHLSRKFKQDTNRTIIDFIHLQRVNAAKLYLQSENISITNIAFMVGFNDMNYFSRVFKNTTGSTPSQFRKMYMK